MRHRSSRMIFASLLILFGGCVDTAEPTGPVPKPPPEEEGEELSPLPVEREEARSSRAGAPGRQTS